MASEADWHGLHPASVAVNLLPRTWQFVRGAWPLLLIFFFGGGGAENTVAGVLDLGILLFFLAMTVGATIVHFLTLRYRVADGRLEIATGLLQQQVRVIAPNRIQNIETVQNVFHKATGLVEVRIETAAGGETTEGLLSALDVDSAKELVEALEAARNVVDEPTQEADLPVLVHNDLRDLLRYGITETRLGAAAVAVGIGFEALTWLDPARVEEVSDVLGALGAFAIVLVVISGAWILGVGAAITRFYDFALLQKGRSLVAQGGLFTRRRVELPVDKIQVVTVTEPLLRRLVGIASVSIETAAVREEGGGTSHAEALIPVVEKAEVPQVVQATVPAVDIDLADVTLLPPDPRALKRAIAAGSGRTAVLCLLLSVLMWPYGLVSWLLVPLVLGLAVLDHRHQGWLVTGEVIITRRGWLRRRTTVVARRKLQSVVMSQGPIMRNYGLGRLGLRVAGSSVVLPDLDEDQAADIQLILAAPLPARAAAAATAPPRSPVLPPSPASSAAPG